MSQTYRNNPDFTSTWRIRVNPPLFESKRRVESKSNRLERKDKKV